MENPPPASWRGIFWREEGMQRAAIGRPYGIYFVMRFIDSTAC